MNVEGLILAKLSTATLTKAGTTTLTVPAGHRYYLAYLSALYSSDATAVTRTITIYVDHGTPETHLAKFDVTASQPIRSTAGFNVPGYGGYIKQAGQFSLPLPLIAGDVIMLSAANGVAGDDWSMYVVYWDVVVGS